MNSLPIHLVLVAWLSQVGSPTAEPMTERQRSSYAAGVEIGRNLRGQHIDVDVEAFSEGMRDALAARPLRMTEADLAKERQEELHRMRLRSKFSRATAEVNRREGAAFLADNAHKPGVVALPSGLQYKVLRAGTGPRPADADAVAWRFRGTLLDGTEFAASPEGKPASVKVADTPPGVREALKLMPAGSRWQLFVPPALAFGVAGERDVVGPNSTVLYDIELLEVRR